MGRAGGAPGLKNCGGVTHEISVRAGHLREPLRQASALAELGHTRAEQGGFRHVRQVFGSDLDRFLETFQPHQQTDQCLRGDGVGRIRGSLRRRRRNLGLEVGNRLVDILPQQGAQVDGMILVDSLERGSPSKWCRSESWRP